MNMREYISICLNLQEVFMNNSPVFTINEFLEEYKICRSTFFKLIKQNRAPKLMRISRKILITREAALEWQRQMEK